MSEANGKAQEISEGSRDEASRHGASEVYIRDAEAYALSALSALKQIGSTLPVLSTGQVMMVKEFREYGPTVPTDGISEAELIIHRIASRLQWILLYGKDQASRTSAWMGWVEISRLKAEVIVMQEKIKDAVKDC